MMADTAQIWDLWAAEAAAHGLSFARGRLDATDVLFVHAAGAALIVEVRGMRERSSRGATRTRTADTPMARLPRTGDTITRGGVADRSGLRTPRHHGRR